VIFGFQLVDRSLGPILPLFVAALGVKPGDVTFIAGIAFSVLACGAAAGHHLTASLLVRSSGRRVIAGAAIVAALSAGAVQFVHGWRLLVACTAMFGLGVGVATTAAYTAAATAIPSASRGAGFGVLTSASLAAMALSPILSGFVAATSIRAVFVLDAVVLCVLALIVRQLMVEEQSRPASPPTEDA
jgi:MFS family permease